MKIEKIFLSVITVACLVGAFAMPASANDTDVNEVTSATNTSVEERVQSVKEGVKDAVDQRCELVTKRIELAITRYDANKEFHIDKYNTIKSKVAALLDRAEESGYDVSVVRSDLIELDNMIKDFASLYTSFIDILRESESLACGESEGAFLRKLEEARQELLKVRNQSLDIRLFVLNTLRPDILDLKNQKSGE